MFKVLRARFSSRKGNAPVEGGGGLPSTRPHIEDDVATRVCAGSVDCSSPEAILQNACFDECNDKYTRRVVSEIKRLFSESGRAEQREAGVRFTVLDRGEGEKQDLSQLRIELLQAGMNQDSIVFADMKKRNIDALVLEATLPPEYPLAPPFVRVVFPRLTGGFVFTHGAICFELLVKSGWSPTMTLLSVAQAIKGILDFNHVRIEWDKNDAAYKPFGPMPGYTLAGAKKDHRQLQNAHAGGNWVDKAMYKS